MRAFRRISQRACVKGSRTLPQCFIENLTVLIKIPLFERRAVAFDLAACWCLRRNILRAVRKRGQCFFSLKEKKQQRTLERRSFSKGDCGRGLSEMCEMLDPCFCKCVKSA